MGCCLRFTFAWSPSLMQESDRAHRRVPNEEGIRRDPREGHARSPLLLAVPIERHPLSFARYANAYGFLDAWLCLLSSFSLPNAKCGIGTITGSNPDGYTHALFSRFPSKEDLKTYYDSPIRWKIANEYIIPYYNVWTHVSFMHINGRDLRTPFPMLQKRAAFLRLEGLLTVKERVLCFAGYALCRLWGRSRRWHRANLPARRGSFYLSFSYVGSLFTSSSSFLVGYF
jgi:hypothetical protein